MLFCSSRGRNCVKLLEIEIIEQSELLGFFYGSKNCGVILSLEHRTLHLYSDNVFVKECEVLLSNAFGD